MIFLLFSYKSLNFLSCGRINSCVFVNFVTQYITLHQFVLKPGCIRAKMHCIPYPIIVGMKNFLCFLLIVCCAIIWIVYFKSIVQILLWLKHLLLVILCFLFSFQNKKSLNILNIKHSETKIIFKFMSYQDNLFIYLFGRHSTPLSSFFLKSIF
jgi:hypothetical protein